MATNNNEPAKLLLPYLQRADELQSHEPLVAYYCRLYAMERGLKIPQSERTKTTSSILVSLMKQLEKDKKALKLSSDDHLHLEGFALNVFAKADKQDRAGRADINTAKTFYAASIFFEILNQFGELAPDLEQKQKYAVWKAADIRKALKEGRRPVAGPPGAEEDTANPSSAPSGDYNVEPKQTGHDINPGPELDQTPPAQFPDDLRRQSSTDIPPPLPSFPSGDYPSHNVDYPSLNADYPSLNADYPSHNADYPSQKPDYHSYDYQTGHTFGSHENPTYTQPYQTQTYPQEPQHPPQIPQNYHSQDIPPPNSYPNFQSYPSFSESSLPAAPSHHPSYYQGSDASYAHQSSPSVTDYASAPQFSSSGRNGSVQVQNVPTSVQPPASVQTYHYDSNYQPAPEKIAEAHKAARFAVGALAFDEVPVAIEHLKKALEYLTNPSAGQ